MDKVFTEQPILDAGIRSVNFFNGRLLTAEDLTAEQTANLLANRMLGQAIGAGIAAGFFVSLAGKAEDFSVTVQAGLAVNRRGDVLQLAQNEIVSLTGSVKNPSDQVASVFSDCTASPSGQFTPTGLYLLTISPASAGEGRAPTSGLGNTTASCNTRFIVQGVTFHLIRLSTPAISNQLRNILAYQSFGFLSSDNPPTANPSPLLTALESPFASQPSAYGLLDSLSPDKYPVCHVPLALIFTTPGQVNFIDNWSVRRLVTPQTVTQPWQIFQSPRRISEALAAFLQFQEHLSDLLANKLLTSASAASTYFKMLPPVGLLPSPSGGLDWHNFLGSHGPAYEIRPDSGLLTQLLAEALTCSPFVVEDSVRPPAALDVYAVPVSPINLVKALDANLAGQLEQVDHDTLSNLLNLNQNDPGFVLFTRSQRGRVRLFFTPHNFQNSKASFDIASTESNLDFQGSFASNGDIVSPDLEHGFYLVNGAIQGFKPIPPYAAKVNPGQVTKIQITPVALTLRLCLVRELIDQINLRSVRFCLVEGTFDDAVVLSANQPWANYFPIDVSDLAAQKQLHDWQDVFESRYPEQGIAKSDPQILISDTLAKFGEAVKADGKAKINIIQKTVDSAQAFVVFGEIGFPLTMVANTNINRDPLPLVNLAKTLDTGISKGILINQNTVTMLMIKRMLKYGILYVEQAAGAWLELIMDAAGVSKTQASLIIQTFIRLLMEYDKTA